MRLIHGIAQMLARLYFGMRETNLPSVMGEECVEHCDYLRRMADSGQINAAERRYVRRVLPQILRQKSAEFFIERTVLIQNAGKNLVYGLILSTAVRRVPFHRIVIDHVLFSFLLYCPAAFLRRHFLSVRCRYFHLIS